MNTTILQSSTALMNSADYATVLRNGSELLLRFENSELSRGFQRKLRALSTLTDVKVSTQDRVYTVSADATVNGWSSRKSRKHRDYVKVTIALA